MAVAEVARSCGKTASGEGGGSSGGSDGGSAGGGLGNGTAPAPVYMPNWPLVRVVIVQSTIKTVAIATALVSIALPLQAHDARATSTAIGSRLVSDKKVEIGVGTKTELRGAQVQAQQIAFVHTDPAKAGELILGGSTNTTQTAHTEKTETLGLYQEMKGQGQTTQTLNQTQLHGNVHFDAALKITAQIPNTAGGQSLKGQINSLVTQGNGLGLDYLSALAANPNVKWEQVALAHEKWNYDQAGLTPAGAALLTIAVAAYTGGMGVELLGTTAAGSTTAAGMTLATTTTTGAMAYTATGVAINAGFTALASQAAVTLINNRGDIGKTLGQLGKEESIKNLLTVMVTAGALSNLNQTLGFNGQSGPGASGTNGITTTQAANQFTSNLLQNVTNNLAGAAIDSGINGKPFDERTLSAALSSALITAGMAQGANTIGASDLNSFTNKLAHAAFGCAGGAAMGGSCKSGAVGAVVGELAAEYINPTADPSLKEQTLAFAKTMAAVAGVIVGGGGNNAADVNVAATAGANAAENNYLSPKNNLKRNIAQDACAKNPGSSACNTAAKLKAIDQRTDEALAKVAAACTPGNLAACQELIRTVNQLSSAGKAELQAMMNELQPSCAPPRDCTQAANWAKNELKGLERLAGSVWRTNASGQLEQTVGPEGVMAGGALAALRLSALGFGAGSSFDAAGQLWQNGTVRWEQSLVAGITAGVGTPLAARGGWRTAGVAGGLASAANTTFNNVYYGEETNIWIAAGLGAGAGAIAPGVGRWFSNLATPWLTQTPRIPISGATPTFPIQSRWPGAPGVVKTGAETAVGNIPSFISLDPGKKESN